MGVTLRKSNKRFYKSSGSGDKATDLPAAGRCTDISIVMVCGFTDRLVNNVGHES